MSMKELTPPEAQAAREADSRAIYLDVRTVQEFVQGHPEGALNIPIATRGPFGMQPNEAFLAVVERVVPKDVPVLCGCQMGGRSFQAAQVLLRSGWTDVANVIGGWGGGPHPSTGDRVAGWRDAGLPTAAGDTEGAYARLQPDE